MIRFITWWSNCENRSRVLICIHHTLKCFSSLLVLLAWNFKSQKFDFGVFFSIPAYLHFTEIYSVDLLPADSQRGHLFNIYTMLKLELFSHSWRKDKKSFLRFCLYFVSRFYLLFSKIMEKQKPKPRILRSCFASLCQAEAIPKLQIWKSQFEKLLFSPNEEILWIARGNCSRKYVRLPAQILRRSPSFWLCSWQ